MEIRFNGLRPFVPGGKDFEKSKQLFVALGFTKVWDDGGYAGFEKDDCKFILQDYDVPSFAENLMITVGVSSAAGFRAYMLEKKIPETFGVRVGEVFQQPYGKEVNLIDIAGVCWHFVEN